MAYYSNFHHSNHPNFKQPYGGRPHRSPRGGSDQGGYGGGPMGGDMGPGGGPGGYSNGSGSYGGGQMGGGPRGGSGYQNGGGSAGGNSGNTLWMGNIDESMDEQFISFAFSNLGVSIQNVKIIRNKDTGLPIGYGFVTFEDRNSAQNVLRELNGKKIPNVEDDKRFFLKPANRQAGGGSGGPGSGSQRFSIFVGNLTPDINDEILYQAFYSYYPSVSSAKVITSDGQSKGYGFVTFENEYDYQTALSNPNMMLGQTPISISRARHSNPGGKNPRFQGDGNGGPQENMNMRSRRQY